MIRGNLRNELIYGFGVAVMITDCWQCLFFSLYSLATTLSVFTQAAHVRSHSHWQGINCAYNNIITRLANCLVGSANPLLSQRMANNTFYLLLALTNRTSGETSVRRVCIGLFPSIALVGNCN